MPRGASAMLRHRAQKADQLRIEELRRFGERHVAETGKDDELRTRNFSRNR
eukprot:gene11698-14888_t